MNLANEAVREGLGIETRRIFCAAVEPQADCVFCDHDEFLFTRFGQKRLRRMHMPGKVIQNGLPALALLFF